jgi:hypothetical protein
LVVAISVAALLGSVPPVTAEAVEMSESATEAMSLGVRRIPIDPALLPTGVEVHSIAGDRGHPSHLYCYVWPLPAAAAKIDKYGGLSRPVRTFAMLDGATPTIGLAPELVDITAPARAAGVEPNDLVEQLPDKFTQPTRLLARATGDAVSLVAVTTAGPAGDAIAIVAARARHADATGYAVLYLSHVRDAQLPGLVETVMTTAGRNCEGRR